MAGLAHVIDGDTLHLSTPDAGKVVKVRLQGVAAPERSKAGGSEATRKGKIFMSTPSYSEHLEVLTAVITHLAMGKWARRTVRGLGDASQLDEEKVQAVLDNFSSLFKKYKTPSKKTGSPYYALHLRHARQWVEGEDKDNGEQAQKEPLDPQYLTILLEFISHRAQEETHRNTAMKVAWISGSIAIGVAAIGAIVSLGIAAAGQC